MSASGRRNPSLGSWALTLGLGLPLYALLVLAVAGYFLPWLDSYLFDTRVLFANNFDKIDELVIAEGPVLEDLLAMLEGWLRTGARGGEYFEFNVLPLAVVARLLETAHPIRAYNLTLAGCWVLAGLCTAGLVHRLARSTGAALWAGALFAFGPMVTNTMRIDSLDYAMLFQLPLLLWALVSMRERRSLAWPLLGGLVLAAMGVTNQYFWLAAVPTAAAWGALCWLRPLEGEAWPAAPGRRGAVLRVAGVIGLGLLLVAPLIAYELTEFWSPNQASINKAIGREVAAPVLLARHGVISPWTLLAVGLGLTAFLPGRRDGPHQGLGFLAGLAILMLGGFGVVTLAADSIGAAVAGLPLIWRLQRLADISVLAVLAISALAGVGLAGLQARLGSRWQRLALLGAAWALLGLCMLQARSETSEAIAASATSLSVPGPVVQQVREAPPQTQIVLVHASPADLPADLLSRYLRLWTGRRTASTRERDAFLERVMGHRRPLERQGPIELRQDPEDCTLLLLVDDPLEPVRTHRLRSAVTQTEHAILHDADGWYAAGLGRCEFASAPAPNPQAGSNGEPDEWQVLRSMPVRPPPEAELDAMLDLLRDARATEGQVRQLFSRAVATDGFIASFGIEPGWIVADIGCGTGAVEVALLELRVPFEKLYAVDTVEENLSFMQRILSAAGLEPGTRIQPTVADNDHSQLPPGALDLALIVNVSSFEARTHGDPTGEAPILDPDALRSLITIRQALRPGGHLLFYADRLPTEFRTERATADPKHPWPLTSTGHYARFPFEPGELALDFAILERSLEAAGFTVTERDILIFEGEVGWMRVTAVAAP